MKKRAFIISVALVMFLSVFAFFPAAALAGSSVPEVMINGVLISGDDSYAYYKNDGSEGSAEDYNYYFNKEDNCLYLNGAQISPAGDNSGIEIDMDGIPTDLVIYVEDDSVIDMSDAQAHLGIEIYDLESGIGTRFTGDDGKTLTIKNAYCAINHYFKTGMITDSIPVLYFYNANIIIDSSASVNEDLWGINSSYDMYFENSKIDITLTYDTEKVNVLYALYANNIVLKKSTLNMTKILDADEDPYQYSGFMFSEGDILIEDTVLNIADGGSMDAYNDITFKGKSQVDIDALDDDMAIGANNEVIFDLSEGGYVAAKSTQGAIYVGGLKTIVLKENNIITEPSGGKAVLLGGDAWTITEADGETPVNAFKVEFYDGNPKTGENISVYIFATAVLLTLTALVVLKKRKISE